MSAQSPSFGLHLSQGRRRLGRLVGFQMPSGTLCSSSCEILSVNAEREDGRYDPSRAKGPWREASRRQNNCFFSMQSTSISVWIPLSCPPCLAELRYPMKEINLGPLYPQPHYFSRYTKVSVMDQGLRVKLLVNHIPAFEFCPVFNRITRTNPTGTLYLSTVPPNEINQALNINKLVLFSGSLL